MSEVSDIESSIWQKYKDQGLVVWGVGGDNDAKETLRGYISQMGITFPVLYDEEQVVQAELYPLEMAIHAPYPSDWVVGVGGELIYVNNEFDAEEMIDVIEAELAKM